MEEYSESTARTLTAGVLNTTWS